MKESLMNPGDIELTSVNWEFGMLLTPEHFLKQERYLEAQLLWMIRNTGSSWGLVGGGPRIPESERGVVKYDPVLTLAEDETGLSVTVSQCRAITPSGSIVEIVPEAPLTRRFTRTEMEAVSEAGVYITAQPFAKQTVDGTLDEFNPEMRTARRPAYSLSLGLPSELGGGYSVAVARLRRQGYGTAFEKDANFIPPCTTMCAHSELMSGWRAAVEMVTALADRYTELFRAMREFLVLATDRGIETSSDAGTAFFVEHMLTLLQTAVFDLLDPLQAPQQFFGRLKRLFYCAAVRFDITPAVQQYFETLKMAGETEFTALLQRQRSLLLATRSWRIGENLAAEIRSVTSSLSALQRLERAMEGKYVDFRVSPSLDAMNFIFDRGGQVLYRIASKASHVQGSGPDLNIYFSQLRLEGREKYRLILVAEENASFEAGERIAVEIRINESSGFHRPRVNLSAQVDSPEQRNFEFDFDAPDIPTITDLIVAVEAHLPVRTALLFIRHRFYADNRAAETPRPAPAPRIERVSERVAEPVAGRSQFPAGRTPDAEPFSQPAPWDLPPRDVAPGAGTARPVQRAARNPEPEPQPPPRRRRLE